ncbi:MAG: hypothetical protein QM737_20950 [Ferruginibacter sp.]
MKIFAENIYHIYNQGNNKGTIFYDDSDYKCFLNLFKQHVSPVSKVLAYCLMPNHFHFLNYSTQVSAQPLLLGKVESCELSNSFRLLQSLYAQNINVKYNRTGSVFRQKAKAICLADGSDQYPFTAFNYIHQNPLKAGLIKRMEDWPYSSFNDFSNPTKEGFCDIELAEQLIGFNKDKFIWESYQFVDEELTKRIFNKNDYLKY